MKEFNELVSRLRDGTGLPVLKALMNEAADAILTLQKDAADARNELCLYCGQYKQKHNGACGGCRWE